MLYVHYAHTGTGRRPAASAARSSFLELTCRWRREKIRDTFMVVAHFNSSRWFAPCALDWELYLQQKHRPSGRYKEGEKRGKSWSTEYCCPCCIKVPYLVFAPAESGLIPFSNSFTDRLQTSWCCSSSFVIPLPIADQQQQHKQYS